MEFVSPSLCRVMGMKPAELVGRPLLTAHQSVEGIGAEMAGLWRELSAPPYRAEREMDLRAPQGVRRIVWTFEALLGDGGGLQGVFGVGRDVTERRAAEGAARRRLELETMLAAISSRLSGAEATGMQPALDFALTRLGEGTGLDAVRGDRAHRRRGLGDGLTRVAASPGRVTPRRPGPGSPPCPGCGVAWSGTRW